MKGEEGKRQIFAWELFKNAGEKNTKGGKYNSPEGQKCLYITQTSIAIQSLYTTWQPGQYSIIFPSSSMQMAKEKLFISLQRIWVESCLNYPEIGLQEERDNFDWRDFSSSSKSSAKNSSGTMSLGWVSQPYQASEFPSASPVWLCYQNESLQQFLLLAAALLLLQGLELLLHVFSTHLWNQPL